MVENGNLAAVTALVRTWEEEHAQPNYDPIPLLTKLAEIVEEETDNYLKMDPDPFDERHPSRTDPTCNLGQILKVLFKKDNFSNKLISDYMRDSHYSRQGMTGNVNHLNMAACRLVIDIMPGLDTTVVFQPDSVSLIHRLIKWATGSTEPLQTYATGLLGAAMEIPDIATKFRDQNNVLIPALLTRLRSLKDEMEVEREGNLARPFGHLAKYKSDGSMMSPPQSTLRIQENGVIKSPKEHSKGKNTESRKRKISSEGGSPGVMNTSDETTPKRKCLRLEDTPEPVHIGNMSPQKASGNYSETSNSSWAELETFMIGTIQMSPLTNITKQIFILRYLTAMGDYQEFLSHVFEKDALKLIFYYVNVRKTKEARLAFEALKYLAALLCHKKFSIEFIQCKGLEALLEVPRPSIAATGVSICLYYLGYCEEAMERVCMFPTHLISSLVKYALWLLECSHDSGRCQAIMFFGLTFQFRVILDEFDEQDGLRKLHNVIATLPILLPDTDSNQLNEEQEGAARQIVRHVCVAYRRYLEAHLFLKVETIRSSQLWLSDDNPMPTYKACKSSPEEIQQQIDMLFQNMPFRSHWAPVDQLLKLGDVTLLLKIIAFAYEWNYSGRAETVRSALDVLAIACVMPKVQALFCDRVDLPDESMTVGMNIILGAAEGDIVADTDVQKAALRVIGNCVCAPIIRIGVLNSTRLYGSTTATNSPNKKLKMKSSEDLIQKVWDCVRSNSGIMVLLQLMQVKTPITDADCIKTLACKALAGLARSEAVRQIVSKLPLFVSGQLQNLMRDPILQEKRQEHVMFQKYVLELLERLSGKGKHTGIDLEASLAKIHRANIVAQTKIRFNDRQLLQLIHQHLVQKGFPDTAATLVKEANLSHVILPLSSQHPQKFKYSSTLTPARVRLSFSSPNIHRVLPSCSAVDKAESTPNGLNNTSVTTSGIKIIKKVQSLPKSLTPSHNSRLQKQTSCEPHPWYHSFQEESLGNDQPRVTLDSITTEYLANQHALCKNPMATCPQFNLFVPHKCPDPKPRITAANNYVIRYARRQIGFQSKPMDRRFVHSRFCPVQTIRTSTDDGFFTCVTFMPTDHTLVAGDFNGDVHLFNLHNANEIRSFTAHNNYIVNMEVNRTGKLLLTSCTWGKPTSAMWDVTHFKLMVGFNDDEYVEFSKVSQDKVIGTKGEVAVIYDVNTCNPISRLVPRVSNQYTKNKATFSYNDELVLSDGVLFDANSGQQIHKLDKLNQTQSGVFHPNGLEIVSNTEVWDIRTFHLLKTVPSLNQCTVMFSPFNTPLYAISMEHDMDEGDVAFETSFKTIDAVDYSSIATIDVKKSIYDLAVNKFDTQIALVENMGMFNSIQESVVRVYDVGRRRDDEDEQEEEDEEEEDDLGSDDENSDNDNASIDMDNPVEEEGENNREDGDDNNSDSNSSWTSTSDSDEDRDNHHILLNFEF